MTELRMIIIAIAHAGICRSISMVTVGGAGLLLEILYIMIIIEMKQLY